MDYQVVHAHNVPQDRTVQEVQRAQLVHKTHTAQRQAAHHVQLSQTAMTV